MPLRRLILSGATAMRAIKAMTPWLSDVKLSDYQNALKKNPNSGKGYFFANPANAKRASVEYWRKKRQTVSFASSSPG